jgi:hypothetical protein
MMVGENQPVRESRLPLRHILPTAAAGLALFVSGCGFGGRDTKNTTPVRTAGTEAPLAPQPEVYDDAQDQADLYDIFQGTFDTYGISVAVAPPDEHLTGLLNSAYTNNKGLPTDPIPPLTEAVFMRDKTVFKKRESDYPLQIYNTTKIPINVQFNEFVIRSIQDWYEHQHGKVLLDNAIESTLTRNENIHQIVVTDRMPESVVKQIGPDVKGVTFGNYPQGVNTTFLAMDVGSVYNRGDADVDINGVPFYYFMQATEDCQQTITASNAHVLIGGSASSQEAERYVSGFNPVARHNIDLVTQERICNGVADYLTMLYFFGEAGTNLLVRNSNSSGLSQTRVFDYTPFIADTQNFLRIMDSIRRQPEPILAVHGVHTPTVDAYK